MAALKQGLFGTHIRTMSYIGSNPTPRILGPLPFPRWPVAVRSLVYYEEVDGASVPPCNTPASRMNCSVSSSSSRVAVHGIDSVKIQSNTD